MQGHIVRSNLRRNYFVTHDYAPLRTPSHNYSSPYKQRRSDIFLPDFSRAILHIVLVAGDSSEKLDDTKRSDH